MIIGSLQLISCVALAGAAIRWRFAHPAGANAHRFLFPFIIAAGLLGCLVAASYARVVFLMWYSGSIYHIAEFRIFGWAVNVWYATAVVSLLPMLPASGLFPAVGKRPGLMAVLAMIALVPSVIVLSGAR